MIPHCFRLERQLVWSALRLALARAGSNMAARMAMMAITTSNSIKVNPRAPRDNFGSVFIIEQNGQAFPLHKRSGAWPPNALLKDDTIKSGMFSARRQGLFRFAKNRCAPSLLLYYLQTRSSNCHNFFFLVCQVSIEFGGIFVR